MRKWKKVLIAALGALTLGGAANVVAFAAGDSSPRPGAVDVKGPCDEAEHADEPRCAGRQVLEDKDGDDRDEAEEREDEADEREDDGDEGEDHRRGHDEGRDEGREDNSGPSENSGPGSGSGASDNSGPSENAGSGGGDSSGSGSSGSGHGED